MNTLKTLSMVMLVAFGAMTAGCGQKQTASAQEAIEVSKSKGTVQEQADYLVGQAQTFLSKENYDQALVTANHILTNLDQNSKAAQDILMKARTDMQNAAQGTVNDVKKKFGNLGK